MKKQIKNNNKKKSNKKSTFKYKLAGVLVLLVTVFFYKATDLITFAKNSTNLEEKKYFVYTREVGEIPVLKEALDLSRDFDNIEDFKDDLLLDTGEKSTDLNNDLSNKTDSDFDIKNLTSKAVYIEDVDTATQLFEKNGERLLLPASTTKTMTALVAMDVYSLDQILTVSDVEKVEGFHVGLFTGEKITVRNLLKAALIQSSNDAAYTLATNHPEGLEGFVKLMNKKAKDFNLRSTVFNNPAGFDHEKQRSSAHDLAIISKEFMKNDFLKSVVGIKKTTITNSDGDFEHDLYNTHQLLGMDESVVGIKTGTTQGASEVLITQFNRNDRNILIVIMGSENRYKETSDLIDWVFDSYVWLTPEEIIEKS